MDRGNDDPVNKIVSFYDLNAWKHGHILVLAVYKVTKYFPQSEQFGLVNQMRRSSISVTSNLAEGFNRQSYREKVRFYSMALGSITEVQNQLRVARDIGILSYENFKDMSHTSEIVHKLINGLIKSSKSHYS